MILNDIKQRLQEQFNLSQSYDLKNHTLSPLLLKLIAILKAHKQHQLAERLSRAMINPLEVDSAKIILNTIIAIERLIAENTEDIDFNDSPVFN